MNLQDYEVRCSAGKVETLILTTATNRGKAKNQAAQEFRRRHKLAPSVFVKTEIVAVDDPKSKSAGKKLSSLLLISAAHDHFMEEEIARNRQEVDKVIEFMFQPIDDDCYIRLVFKKDLLSRGLAVNAATACLAEKVFTTELIREPNWFQNLLDLAEQMGKTGQLLVRMNPEFKEPKNSKYLLHLAMYLDHLEVVQVQREPA